MPMPTAKATATATAMWFCAPGVVELGDAPLPEPGDDDVVVRTIVSGISGGTEMLAYRGELDERLVLDESISSLGTGTFAYPFRYGYSCVGTVERAGGAVPAGSLVFGLHPHQDVFVAPAAEVVVLANGTDPRRATLFPLIETALQISLDAGAVYDDVVVVTGLGVVGLLTCLLLAEGGARVIAAEPLAWRRRLADDLGITAVEPDQLRARVEDATSGAGAALMVETSGNPDVLGPALALLAHEGTALVASWYGTKEVALPLGGPFHRRRLTVRSTQVSTIPASLAGRWTRERRRTVVGSLLGRLPLERVATHEFAFADAAAAFAAVDMAEQGLVHAALCYR